MQYFSVLPLVLSLSHITSKNDKDFNNVYKVLATVLKVAAPAKVFRL